MRVGKRAPALVILAAFLAAFCICVHADTREEIDNRADNTMERFYKRVRNGKNLVEQAHGVLIFPRVYKAGFVVGYQYGEGVLRVNGKSVDYYSLNTASFGFQLGADQKQIVLLFMDQKVFDLIRNSKGWKAGVDASVTLNRSGDTASIDTMGEGPEGPILGYVIGRRGLMYDLTLEGTKFDKWPRPKK